MQYFNWSDLVKNYVKPAGNGAEAVYWKMDDTKGLKVIRTPFRLPNGEGCVFHTNQDALFVSSKWREVQRQFDLMKELAKRKRCPRPIDLAVICDDRAVNTGIGYLFYPAIIMEHVQFTEYSHNTSRTRNKAFYAFLRHMEKIVTLVDTHGGNIVFNEKTKRFMVLDLGGVDKK